MPVHPSILPTEDAAETEWVDAALGAIYERVMQHIPAQFERQGHMCHTCGRDLSSPADGLLRIDGKLDCIACTLAFSHTSG